MTLVSRLQTTTYHWSTSGRPKANVCKTDFANEVGIFRKAACSLHDP